MLAVPEAVGARARPDEAGRAHAVRQSSGRHASSAAGPVRPFVAGAQTDLSTARDTLEVREATAQAKRRSPMIYALPVIAVLAIVGGAIAVRNGGKDGAQRRPAALRATAVADPLHAPDREHGAPAAVRPSRRVEPSAQRRRRAERQRAARRSCEPGLAPPPHVVVPPPHLPSESARHRHQALAHRARSSRRASERLERTQVTTILASTKKCLAFVLATTLLAPSFVTTFESTALRAAREEEAAARPAPSRGAEAVGQRARALPARPVGRRAYQLQRGVRGLEEPARPLQRRRLREEPRPVRARDRRSSRRSSPTAKGSSLPTRRPTSKRRSPGSSSSSRS